MNHIFLYTSDLELPSVRLFPLIDIPTGSLRLYVFKAFKSYEVSLKYQQCRIAIYGARILFYVNLVHVLVNIWVLMSERIFTRNNITYGLH